MVELYTSERWGSLVLYFPPAVDEAGLPAEVNAADEDPGEPYFGKLPADDWAA